MIVFISSLSIAFRLLLGHCLSSRSESLTESSSESLTESSSESSLLYRVDFDWTLIALAFRLPLVFLDGESSKNHLVSIEWKNILPSLFPLPFNRCVLALVDRVTVCFVRAIILTDFNSLNILKLMKMFVLTNNLKMFS